MKLTAHPLKNVTSVNYFDLAKVWQLTVDNTVTPPVGEQTSLYFQVYNEDQDLRYIPEGATTVTVTFPNLDPAKLFSVIASQPYNDDKSLFKIDLLSSMVPSSGAVRFSLTDNNGTKIWSVTNMMSVIKLNSGAC
jgi:hypothetical protein